MARRVSWVVAVLSFMQLAASAPPRAAVADEPAATIAWRATREADLRKPDGWLSVAGLFFLRPGANVVGSGPGADVALTPGGAPAIVGTITRDEQVWFEPAAGVVVTVDGVELRAKTAIAASQRLTAGRVTFFLHQSGERLAVRVRDPESELRRKFRGLQWFPIRADWRVIGTFVPYETPKPALFQNILGDIERYVSPGEVVFRVNGVESRLQAVRSGRRLWFVFSDATAGRDTYRIRFLYAEAPSSTGEVVLDFNRAQNPPCAYNPYTTCPRPPAQNYLRVAVSAGERLPR